MGRQFGTFDGLDNRKAVLEMFRRMGDDCSEEEGAARRACFLSDLMKASPKFGDKGGFVTPCDPTSAYMEFVAITGCLGVNIEQAAIQLEETVR
jgi:hypothetical protein